MMKYSYLLFQYPSNTIWDHGSYYRLFISTDRIEEIFEILSNDLYHTFYTLGQYPNPSFEFNFRI